MRTFRKEIKLGSYRRARSCITYKPNSPEKVDSLWSWNWRQWDCLNEHERELTSHWTEGGVQPGAAGASQPPPMASMPSLPLTSTPLQAPALSLSVLFLLALLLDSIQLVLRKLWSWHRFSLRPVCISQDHISPSMRDQWLFYGWSWAFASK